MSDGEPRTINEVTKIIDGNYRIIANAIRQAEGVGRFEKAGRTNKAVLYKITESGLALHDKQKLQFNAVAKPSYVPNPHWAGLVNAWR